MKQSQVKELVLAHSKPAAQIALDQFPAPFLQAVNNAGRLSGFQFRKGIR
jgi:hypothetical protein